MSRGRELTSSVSPPALNSGHWLRAAYRRADPGHIPCPAISHLSEAEPAATGIIHLTGIGEGRNGSVTGPRPRPPSDGRGRRYGVRPARTQTVEGIRYSVPYAHPIFL